MGASADQVQLSCVEICAGGGGQSLGLELAGFAHRAVIEIDSYACQTLRLNRPLWNVIEGDIRSVDCREYLGIDLLAGGVPCPPFSIAGRQLGADDERDLFPRALELVEECEPTAIMLENVRGLATARFSNYRESVLRRLHELGYATSWRVLNASEFGVPQLRPRFILVAMRPEVFAEFEWPKPVATTGTVGEKLADLMAANGWSGAGDWVTQADGIGPTLVGGSRKHGGPDLGPTRARKAWLKLRVDGRGLADAAPGAADPSHQVPRLTVEMAAALQGFPPEWRFAGGKTAQYRQVGNAFPAPVAAAVGSSIKAAIDAARARARPTVEREPLTRAVWAV